jgi:hypothetical protein
VVRRGKKIQARRTINPTQEFKRPYKMLNTMICRLYGEEKSTHFHMEWMPMAYTVVKTGKIFNWVDILTFNIFQNVKNSPGMKNPSFYMSAYLIDVVCSSIQFPTFGWSWDQNQPLVHVYCSELWEVNYKKHIYDICDFFLAPLHTIIFGYPTYRISKESMATLKDIADWYMRKYYTYIKVYGNSRAPHILPRYVPDRLLIQEISYQTMETGITFSFQVVEKISGPHSLSI